MNMTNGGGGGFVVLAAAALLLGGCAQNDAGLTRAKVTWCDGHICGAEIIDGKEKAVVGLKVAFPDGAVVEYSATDVKAFRAFEIRGAVENALIETTGKAVPEVVSAVTRAVLGVAGLEAITGAVGAKAALQGAQIKADTALEGARIQAGAAARKP